MTKTNQRMNYVYEKQKNLTCLKFRCFKNSSTSKGKIRVLVVHCEQNFHYFHLDCCPIFVA